MAFARIGRFLRILDTWVFHSGIEADVKKALFLVEYSELKNMKFVTSTDPVRFGAMEFAIRRIFKEGIEGNLAEVGVWKGVTSRFIHQLAPDRTLYLFDTFEGFPREDLEGREVSQFSDTSVETVEKNIGDLRNVRIRKGYFPDTLKGLEKEKFAFVLLDLDLYAPTMAGLEFFYERISPGGYIFFHDYNCSSPICDVTRAVDSFFRDKPEGFIEFPDAYGSIAVRRLKE